MSRKNIPGYLKHKATGQAIVVLQGKTVYLGRYKSKASREAYEKIIAEYLANGKKLPPTRSRTEVTIEELAVKYLEYAEEYYSLHGGQSRTFNHCQHAMAPLVRYYGSKLVSEFGPLSLKFIRDKWIARRHSRHTISKRVGFVKQAFRWGVENELVPPDVYHALQAVAGLRQGRSAAVEPKPVLPVDDEIVEKTLPHLPPVVADMVQVQRFAGLRPQDVINLRGCDID